MLSITSSLSSSADGCMISDGIYRVKVYGKEGSNNSKQSLTRSYKQDGIKSHKINKNTLAATHISMLVGMSWKLAAILGRRELQQEFTEGPLCWTFMPGFKVVIAACSRRLS